MDKGTCLQTYIPVRSEPRSGAEMVTCLVFGESYTVVESSGRWTRIKTDFDQYEGWISANTVAAYQPDFSNVCDSAYIEAIGRQQRLLIPCGGLIPESGELRIDGEKFTIEKKLKTNHHLPLPLRLSKLAISFLNTPYLWGGRTFMGIDCSGFVQVLFKACDMVLPRDTSQQVHSGEAVPHAGIRIGDLVFFSNPDAEKVTHVGMMLDSTKIIHASGKVRIDTLSPEGLMMNGELTYKTVSVRRMF